MKLELATANLKIGASFLVSIKMPGTLNRRPSVLTYRVTVLSVNRMEDEVTLSFEVDEKLT